MSRRRRDGISVSAAAVASALGLLLPLVVMLPNSLGDAPLGPFPSSVALDYDTRAAGAVPELTSRFVSSVLGDALEEPAPVDVPNQVAPVAASSAPVSPSVGASARPAPGPDEFAGALPIESLPFRHETDAASASRQRGEPAACASGGTIWFRITPQRDLSLVVSTIGSTLASGVAVYRGSTLESLESIGCRSSVTGNARLGVPLQAGQEYRIQLVTTAGRGTLVLNAALVGTTSRLSVAPDGSGADAASSTPSMSADGRYVAFASAATNLADGVPEVCPLCSHVFVHDRVTGAITIESVAEDGTLANGASFTPALSADGRYLAFASDATNLGPGQPTAVSQIWVRDRVTGRVVPASVNTEGTLADSTSYQPAISADGTRVLFGSYAANLRPDGGVPCGGHCISFSATDAQRQVYVHDLTSGVTTFVSGPEGGGQPDGVAQPGDISGDGRYVVFSSMSTGMLHDEDIGENGLEVYRRHVDSGELVWVSRRRRQSTFGSSRAPSISHDGGRVAFVSDSDALVDGDENLRFDVFVWDGATGSIQRASVSSDGAEGVAPSSVEETSAPRESCAISADGRYVVFDTDAEGLVPDDTNARSDVFRHDLLTGATIRVSVGSDGTESDGHSSAARVSADGRVTAFLSSAENLVAGDENLMADVFAHEVSDA